MSAFDYSGLAVSSAMLVNKFGRTITKRSNSLSGDEWNPTIVSIDLDIIGVVTTFNNSEIDGSLILASDKKLLTYSSVDIKDIIVIDGEDHSVISVQAVKPSTTALLYKVQIRR